MGNLGEYVDGGIDPTQHEPSKDFTPLPPGWYPVEVEACEIKDTKAGTGKMLKVTLSVIGEQFNGRKLFPSINILNPSSKATEIGRRELADLARACNIPFLDDEDKLLGCQLEVKVKVKADEGFEPDNEVKGYRPLGGGQQQAATPTPPAAKKAAPPPVQQAKTTPTAKATGKMPWER